MSEPLSPLAEVILDCIRQKGRTLSQTEIAMAEYELQLRGFTRDGCCGGARYLTTAGEAYQRRLVALTEEQVAVARTIFAGKATEAIATLYDVLTDGKDLTDGPS